MPLAFAGESFTSHAQHPYEDDLLKRFAPLIAFLAFAPLPLFAVESVKSPVVDEGLWEFEYKGKFQHDAAPAKTDEKEQEFNAAYGFTPRWKAKLEATFEQKRNSDFYTKGVKWENILNLNGRDTQHEAVFGLYQDIFIADRSDSSHSITLGLLAKRDFGKFLNLGNVYVKHDFGDTQKNGIYLIYRWQTKYDLLPYFQPGFEVLGDTQTNDKFEDQNLVAGPMAYGSFEVLGVKGLGYEVGYLFGATRASRDGTVKWKLKYAFHY